MPINFKFIKMILSKEKNNNNYNFNYFFPYSINNYNFFLYIIIKIYYFFFFLFIEKSIFLRFKKLNTFYYKKEYLIKINN